MNHDNPEGQNKGAVRFFSLTILLILLSTTTACTKHYSTAVTSIKPLTASTEKRDTLSQASLTDSLVGTWKIRKTEVAQIMDKMTSYGSQTERDNLIAKQKEYQTQFLSLTAVFKNDKTYQSTFNGQSDIGTWRVSRKLEIETLSKVSGNASSFQVISLENGILTTKFETADVSLVLTFVKQ